VPKGYYHDPKNADYKRCVKERWLGKRKRKSGTIGLTVYEPCPSQSKRGGRKCLAKEENDSSGNSSGEEEVEVTSAKSDPNTDQVAATQNRVTVTRRQESATWSWVTTTQTWVTAAQTQVTTARVRGMTGKKRSRSRWTSTWSSRSRYNSVHNQKTSWSWRWVWNVSCLIGRKTRACT
jgi:hypothetical protein